MPPNQSDDGMPQVTFRLPAWLLDASEEEAHQRNKEKRSENWNRSRLWREAILEYMEQNDIAPETVDELEDHMDVTGDAGEVEV